MDSYIRLTQEEQRIMDGISIPTGARKRVQTKFIAITQTKSKHVIKVSAFVFSGMIAVIALIVGILPSSQETIGSISFLEVAYAAYENMSATIDEGYPVHHIVTETKISGTDNGPITEKTESWSLSESLRSLTANQLSISAETEYFAKSGESSYVSQELATQISNQLSSLGKDGTMYFYSGDSNLEVSGANPGYALSFPKNLYSISSAPDPLNPTIECFDLEEKSAKQLERELLIDQLKQVAGYDVGNSVFDPQQIITLLLKGKNSGQVEDLGVYPDDSGHSQQWYRIVVQIDSESSHEIHTTTFGFDTENHRLLTVTFVTDDMFESLVTHVTRITTDEFIAIDDAHPGLMDPEGQNLVKVTYPVNDLPAYSIEDGCYRLNADRPERLSTKEEVDIRDRIRDNETE